MVIENFIVPSQLPRRYHDGASLLDRTTAAIALGFVSVSLLVCLSLCLWHCLSLSLSVFLSVCLFVIVSRPYVASHSSGSYKTALPSSLQFDSPLTSPRLDSVWFGFGLLRFAPFRSCCSSFCSFFRCCSFSMLFAFFRSSAMANANRNGNGNAKANSNANGYGNCERQGEVGGSGM